MKIRAARSCGIVAAGLALMSASPWAAAEMKQIARVAPDDGVLLEAFAFADGGAQLAYVKTDTDGKTRLHIGSPGGRSSLTDLTSFTRDPEKILFVGGHWFVISNEGARRAAVVGANGRIENHIGPFDDCFISTVRGKTFVTVTDKGDAPAGHAYAISAYRPNGVQMGSKLVTIGPDGTLAGSQGLVFVAFTGGYLQALVKKAGRYDAKTDVRSGTEVAALDLFTGKTRPVKSLPDIPALLRLADKRAEKPGLEQFVRVDDDKAGLELVGPGEISARWRFPRSSPFTRRRRCGSSNRPVSCFSRSPSIPSIPIKWRHRRRGNACCTSSRPASARPRLLCSVGHRSKGPTTTRGRRRAISWRFSNARTRAATTRS